MKLFKLTVLPVPFIKWSPSLIRLPANFHFRPKNIKILFFIYHSKVAALVDLPYFNKYLRAQWCFSGHFVFSQYLLMDDDTNLTTYFYRKKIKSGISVFLIVVGISVDIYICMNLFSSFKSNFSHSLFKIYFREYN